MHRHPNAVRPNETGCPSTFNQNKSFGHQLVYASGPPERSPMQTNPHGAHGSYPLVPSTSVETDSSTLRSLHSFDSRVDPEAFQETDSKTAVSDTPPPAPSSLTASASGTIAPVVAGGLPTAPVSYYPPHAWTAPFGVQMHYPMPYGAYGGMVPHMPVPYAPTGQSSDANSVNSSAQIQWNSMYRVRTGISKIGHLLTFFHYARLVFHLRHTPTLSCHPQVLTRPAQLSRQLRNQRRQ